MYLLILPIGFCVSYFILLFLFSFFFENKTARVTKKSFSSVALVVFLIFSTYIVTFQIPDTELANRVLHGFGGGFLAFLLCFLVTKDGNLQIGKFRFFIFSALIVTAMGVVNEIMEYIIQNYGSLGLIFTDSINDTWLDLVSNAIGMAIASICFVPFVNRKKL